MKKLFKEYHRKGIYDAGAYKSDEFVSFSRKFKNALKRTFPECEILKYHTGHYDVAGFLKKDNNYIYFSFGVPRGGIPMDLISSSAMHGVLYRLARDDSDWGGAHSRNHFCNILEMQEAVNALFEKEDIAA